MSGQRPAKLLPLQNCRSYVGRFLFVNFSPSQGTPGQCSPAPACPSSIPDISTAAPAHAKIGFEANLIDPDAAWPRLTYTASGTRALNVDHLANHAPLCTHNPNEMAVVCYNLSSERRRSAFFRRYWKKAWLRAHERWRQRRVFTITVKASNPAGHNNRVSIMSCSGWIDLLEGTPRGHDHTNWDGATWSAVGYYISKNN